MVLQSDHTLAEETQHVGVICLTHKCIAILMYLQSAYRLTEDILTRGSCELGENNLAAFLIEKQSFRLLNEDLHLIKMCMLTDINILHYSWRFTVFTQLLRI